MPGKRKRADESGLAVEERVRREHQRAAQGMLLAIRAAMGGEREDGDGNAASANRRKKTQRKLEREAKRTLKAEYQRCVAGGKQGHKRGQAVQYDIVVVPIFWKKKVEDTSAVLAVADAVAAQFAKSLPGMRVFVDRSEDFTPGQKYAHWESKGTRLRVEIGPKDVESKTCVLSHFAVPGALAKRIPNLSTSDDMVPLVAAIYRLATNLVVQGIARSAGAALHAKLAEINLAAISAAGGGTVEKAASWTVAEGGDAAW